MQVHIQRRTALLERRRALRLALRITRSRVERATRRVYQSAVFAFWCTVFTLPAYTNPGGGEIVAGEGTISQVDASTLAIHQTSDKLIVNWDDFSISAGEATHFYQPGADAIALNRILGQDPSVILGQLTADGRLVLVNPNGILFGEGSRVDVSGLIATTHDIANDDFLGGNYVFDQSGDANASVVNEGTITAAHEGLVAFVAPSVRNSGLIAAKLGRVELGAASKFTLDFYGDNLISFPVDAEVMGAITGPDGEPVGALVDVDGTIEAATVILTARAARGIVNDVISTGGTIKATTAWQDGGRIVLDGGTNGTVRVNGTLEASGIAGGTIDITGEHVLADGIIAATGQNETTTTMKLEIASATGPSLTESDEPEPMTLEVIVPGGAGGRINIDGDSWVSVGGVLDASGRSGGTINIDSGGLSFAGIMKATGEAEEGGTVRIDSDGKAWVFADTLVDVSGQNGGSILQTSDQQITTSGTYLALGLGGTGGGDGGQIDMTAPVTKLLSPVLATSGLTSGGHIRIGGEYQGGKDLETDELENAQIVVATDGTGIYANTMGAHGNGGDVIIWSDRQTIFLGTIEAMPGTETGEGGFVEVSSGDVLSFNGQIATGYDGREGDVLIDPKNLTIVDDEFSQIQLILGFNYEDTISPFLSTKPGGNDRFGSAVSLDGTMLAVGANLADGLLNNLGRSGEVHLFSFTDASFNGGRLEASIGHGYTGGKNVDLTGILGADDYFGTSVSLDDNRLAVGAYLDDGDGNTLGSSGAVYLFSFTDTVFNGGQLEATIGHGYVGGKNIDLTGTLGSGDNFGWSVSLDGNRLAVGAHQDDGSGNSSGNSGAVHLFSFTDASFNGGSLEATIGYGYAGGKNVDLTGTVGGNDRFGSSVSLDGNRLAVGAYQDDGNGNSLGNSGAVHLFSFSDASFNGGSLEASIGNGYAGGKNIDLSGTLGYSDNLGSSVSLDGTRLAIGAYRDDGYGNVLSNSGAVYLFSFSDTSFNGGSLEATMGYGYTGGKNVDLTGTLGPSDYFGWSLSLDNARLAVGAYQDDGYGNGSGNSGSVHLFSFTDAAFSGGSLEASIGHRYVGGKNIDLTGTLGLYDYFGVSISLDGTRLAVGARGDDGKSNALGNSGAVYLFSFTDTSFNGASLEATIGYGYTGGKNTDLSGTLGSNDYFGTSVSLDGTRLAVGAYQDDGNGNLLYNSGAVHLFSFTDMAFNGGLLEATIGYGYSGGKNIDLTGILGEKDYFGTSISLDGNRLAVGAYSDDGNGNSRSNSGAVYLFSFTDASFNGGLHEATIGYGYTGGKNIDLTTKLGSNDYFGWSVSLDGNRLAVGATQDDGLGNALKNSGAVYMFSFTDASFSSGQLEATLGYGYTGGKNIDLTGTLGLSDNLGSSVSLDGTGLAAGAYNDDGFGNSLLNVGAVHLFSFADTVFNGGLHEATIGYGYTGGKNIDIGDTLGSYDSFGVSVSLDGNRLAVGAYQDDGKGDSLKNSGVVYLLSLEMEGPTGAGDATWSSGSTPDSNSFMTVGTLTALLNNGNNVTLQVNNDLTLATNLIVNNGAGDGGDLTLQAGRSVLLNGDVFTDDGDFTVIANELLSAGVIDSERDAGVAVITMAAGTSIDAGTGSVRLTLLDGAGKTNTTSGDVSLRAINGGTVIVENLGGSGDVVLNGMLEASGNLGDANNTAIVVASSGGNFINNAGASALNPGASRFIVYSQNPSSDMAGGLTATPWYNTVFNSVDPAGVAGTGDRFAFNQTAVLSITVDDATRYYGDFNPVFTGGPVTGFVNGESLAVLTGGPGFATAATQYSGVGTYVITEDGSLATDRNYLIAITNGTLTIKTAPVVGQLLGDVGQNSGIDDSDDDGADSNNDPQCLIELPDQDCGS